MGHGQGRHPVFMRGFNGLGQSACKGRLRKPEPCIRNHLSCFGAGHHGVDLPVDAA